MPTEFRTHRDGVGGTAKIVYDFATDGGSIGDIDLKTVLPIGAVVFNGVIDVAIAPTSAGLATIAIAFGSQVIKAATAIASYTALVALTPVGTAATAIKLTADRKLKLTVAAFALTAGRFTIYVDYYLP